MSICKIRVEMSFIYNLRETYLTACRCFTYFVLLPRGNPFGIKNSKNHSVRDESIGKKHPTKAFLHSVGMQLLKIDNSTIDSHYSK